jgi:hypothetical protein
MNVINGQLQEAYEEEKIETNERLNREYAELQELINNGTLPGPREEIALLAAVQLCIEENWPENKKTAQTLANQPVSEQLLRGKLGRNLTQKLMLEPASG